MTCKHAASGCNAPESECIGLCMTRGGEVSKQEEKAMEDRELLELAAKAAGYCYVWRPYGGSISMESWNPLTDDGDALRLAVALDLSPFQWKRLKHVRIEIPALGKIFEENWKNDPYAATRRVIVRAAAEIGKAMK
jgi:hypothetical protein